MSPCMHELHTCSESASRACIAAGLFPLSFAVEQRLESKFRSHLVLQLEGHNVPAMRLF